jgi:eukaryotic-like serine/threonine-protein kinase
MRQGDLIASRYELRDELGQGGMGAVWLALDRDLDRPVAVKFPDPHADEARFEREAHAAAGLSHPNIVSIYDYGVAEGRRYLVLEHLPGGTLADRLLSGAPLDDAETEAIAGDIAKALAHAHASGVVHRDLKPSNIVFTEDGRAKLTDFGIASSSRETTLTAPGAFLGTAAYISPEQASGESPIGPPADVYSFGVILFQMLTGRLPFEADSAVQLALMHQTAPPPSVEAYRPDAPPGLSALVARALAKEAASRPPDGAAIVHALAALGASEAPTERDTFAMAPAGRQRRPKRRRAALAAFALLAVAGFAAAWLSLGADESTPSPPPLGDVSGRSGSESTGETVSTGLGPTASSVAVSSTATEPTTTRTPPTTTAATTSSSTTTGPGTTTNAGVTTNAGTTTSAG